MTDNIPDRGGVWTMTDAEFAETILEAAATALEDAAKVLAQLPYVRPEADGRAEYERLLAVRRGGTDTWLKERAKALRAKP